MTNYYTVHMNGNRICPICSAMMVKYGEDLYYRCTDCGTRFKVVDFGQAEYELVLEELPQVER